MLANYVPAEGPQNSEMLWLIYGFIALITPVALFAARGWMAGKLKTSAVGG
jgi:hypothetical protein